MALHNLPIEPASAAPAAPAPFDPNEEPARGEFEGVRIAARCTIFEPGSGSRVVLSLRSASEATVQTSFCMTLGDLRGLRDAIDAAIAAAVTEADETARRLGDLRDATADLDAVTDRLRSRSPAPPATGGAS